MADVLSGDYNPAGRLPVTFYKSLAQVPPFSSYSMFGRTYRYFNEPPLFAFGFGLSYSTFVYSDETISSAASDGSATITASVRVTNSSAIPGDEVVELYTSHPGVEGAPIRALAGFQRVHLGAHASQVVSFQLSPRELSIVDLQGNRLVPAGPVEIWIGSSQPLTAPGRPQPNGRALKMTVINPFSIPN